MKYSHSFNWSYCKPEQLKAWKIRLRNWNAPTSLLLNRICLGGNQMFFKRVFTRACHCTKPINNFQIYWHPRAISFDSFSYLPRCNTHQVLLQHAQLADQFITCGRKSAKEIKVCWFTIELCQTRIGIGCFNQKHDSHEGVLSKRQCRYGKEAWTI